MVEPDALLVVELRTGLRATRDVEGFHELVEREELLLGAGIPAQQGQEIDYGLGEIAALAIAARHLARLRVVPLQREHGEAQSVAVALREFSLAFRLEQQRQMGKAGHGVLPAESLVEQHVEWGGGQPLFAADDVRNFHQMVVDDVSQMVRGQFVGTLVEHFVVENVALHAHLATNHVVHQHLAARLNLEAHHVLLAVVDEASHLVGGQRQRVAHHLARLGVVLEVLNLLALLLQFFGRVEGYVGLAFLQQLVDVLLVDGTSLALPVGTVVATKADTLVELDAQPLERLDDILLGSRHEAVGVGVFDTENKVALVLAGEEIVIQGGAHAANMQCPCGTGCKTHPYTSFFHH